jgi:hypothetical protein
MQGIELDAFVFKLKSASSIVNWSRHAKHRQENYDACHPVDFGWRARLSLYIICRWPFILKKQFIVCQDSCIFFYALLYRQKDRASHSTKPARRRRLIALQFSHSNLSQEECPLNPKPKQFALIINVDEFRTMRGQKKLGLIIHLGTSQIWSVRFNSKVQIHIPHFVVHQYQGSTCEENWVKQ